MYWRILAFTWLTVGKSAFIKSLRPLGLLDNFKNGRKDFARSWQINVKSCIPHIISAQGGTRDYTCPSEQGQSRVMESEKHRSPPPPLHLRAKAFRAKRLATRTLTWENTHGCELSFQCYMMSPVKTRRQESLLYNVVLCPEKNTTGQNSLNIL